MANSCCVATNCKGLATSVYVSNNHCTGGSFGGGSSFAAPPDSGIVLVTGACGFIGTHVVQLLMRNGYRVRGTSRNLLNNVKVTPLLNLCPHSKYPLELIEAELNDPDSWDRAVQGCRYVIHLAGQVPIGVAEHGEELIKTSVNGTINVLRACHKYGVKRVVHTSSMSAVYGDFGAKDPPDVVYTENCWTRIETTNDPYVRSKTLAERAAWNFLAQLPECERFELAVVNPAAVFGPLLCGVPGKSSVLIKKMLSRGIPFVPKVSIPVVDVRDVALGHLRAMTVPQAAGRRIILFSGANLWSQDIARIMYKEFESQGYDIETKSGPHALFRFIVLFEKNMALVLPTWGRIQHIDNSAMRSILGITPRASDQTLIDMAYSMIERGFIKRTRKYHGPPSDCYS